MPRWSRLILPCTAIGDTPLQISWFQDGRQLSEWLNLSPSKLGEQIAQPWVQQPSTSDQLASASTADDAGLIQVLTNGSLSIGRLAETAGGNYTCTARNRHGQDQVDYFLTVVTPPLPPQLRFAASNWSSISLQWSSNNANEGRMDRTNNNRTKVSASRNFVVKYRMRTNDGSATASANGYPFQWTEKSLPASWRSVPIGDLNCGTEYEFFILACSRVGNSSSSNLVTAKTKGSPPEHLAAVAEEPLDIVLTATSATVHLANWQDRGCPIQQFVFRFRTADSGEWIIAGAESPPQRNFLLGGLLPAREYAIRVTAINAAGSAVKDYIVKTPPLLDGSHSDTAVISNSNLAPLFSDPRVAVPMAVSSLAILLTVVTLLLRYRYRSGNAGDYIRPDPPQSIGSHIRTYTEGGGTPDDGCSTLSANHKRPPAVHSSTGSGGSDLYADEVSPYAVFPSLLSSSGGSKSQQFSSTRRMKTFVVDGTKDSSVPVEMSNYAAPSRSIPQEPTYDYIAPCPSERGPVMMGRNKLPSNPQSVFVPIIPARSTWNQQYRHGVQHYHTDWNNQETLALSQRLWISFQVDEFIRLKTGGGWRKRTMKILNLKRNSFFPLYL